MRKPKDARPGSHAAVRVAVLAAALAVAGCFGAAISFAQTPSAATETR